VVFDLSASIELLHARVATVVRFPTDKGHVLMMYMQCRRLCLPVQQLTDYQLLRCRLLRCLPLPDPEILERRYPVVLRRFSLRQGSGGAGRFKGGDGVIREVRTTACFLACSFAKVRISVCSYTVWHGAS
jgi:hypothetical protein